MKAEIPSFILLLVIHRASAGLRDTSFRQGSISKSLSHGEHCGNSEGNTGKAFVDQIKSHQVHILWHLQGLETVGIGGCSNVQEGLWDAAVEGHRNEAGAKSLL